MAVDIVIHEPGDVIFVMNRGTLLAYRVTEYGDVVPENTHNALDQIEEHGFVGVKDGRRAN